MNYKTHRLTDVQGKNIPTHTVWLENPVQYKYIGYIISKGKILDLNMMDNEENFYQFQNHDLLKND
jgi:hypothetical protein